MFLFRPALSMPTLYLVIKVAQCGLILILCAGPKAEEMLKVGDFPSLILIENSSLLDPRHRLAQVNIISTLLVSKEVEF